MYAEIMEQPKNFMLCNQNTDWSLFQDKIDRQINLNVPLKTSDELELALHNLTSIIQNAAWESTPPAQKGWKEDENTIVIKNKIAEKRKIRRIWQQTRTKINKQKLNKASSDLKNLLLSHKNKSVQKYLENLSPTQATNYSLWRATRKLNRPLQPIPPIKGRDGKWARNNKEKANVFAKHLADTFKPFDTEITKEDMDEINNYLEAPFQMDKPIKNFSYQEIKEIILKEINPKKAPGYDLITGRILQKLTKKGIKALQQIFNAVIRLRHFPQQWKVAEIIMLPKPGKKPTELDSYRPISLIPTLSKVFEKLILKQMEPILVSKNIIPHHQFGFRKKHGTVEQVHRVVKQVSDDLENRRFCSAAFIDISQAFDKVWYPGLLYKIKKVLPHHFYEILKSYLHNRFFLVKHQSEYTDIHQIDSGVPQGSVLGPILYLLFTSDLPTSKLTAVSTFADDTAILASHHNPEIATRNLQNNLNKIEVWLKKWKIKANELKSQHITFTLRRDQCPPVTLNNRQLKQVDSVKYLGIHLDKRLTWKTHIFNKRKQLGLRLQELYWVIGRKSQLSLQNKIIVYKTIIKPIWTYGIQLWGSASQSNLEIMQRFQNKVLRILVNAPWYVPNFIIERDLHIPTIKSEVQRYSEKYRDRINSHPNLLASELFDTTGEVRRLKRFKPTDLLTRFN